MANALGLPRRLAAAVIALTALPLAASAADRYAAEIVRTTYGAPHITASDYGGLGYGSGYAFAEDNVCLLADQVVTVSGERSKYFGADGSTTVSFKAVNNLDSDIFFKATLNTAQLRQAILKASPEDQRMIRGYVAGYNAYLRKTGPANLPDACRGAPWVRPITEDDLLRLNDEKMTQAGAGAWLGAIIAAAPPPSAPATTAPHAALERQDIEPAREAEALGLGSNGWAFGREATGGAGLLLGNPHFPWLTTNRFYQIHLTIPGQFDAMGATLSGLPGISIGFNHDVAWTHTVSTDRHFTLFELTLVPGNPTAYRVDGRRLSMDRRTVTVEVKGGARVTRTLYSSVYGPLLVQPKAGLNWTSDRAYAFKDSNRLNVRAADAWLAIGRARSVAEVRAAISAQVGVPWVNTIAADRHGEVLYADITSTPDVSAEKLKACAPASGAAALGAFARIFVLDGARSDCDWTREPAAGAPGLLPASAMPSTVRADFVANSNDSYWLANDTQPLSGFSPVVGLTNEPQNMRTRAGLTFIHDQLALPPSASGARISPSVVEAMIFADRNYAAEATLDDLLAICAERPSAAASSGKAVDLTRACGILSRWDRHMNIDSVGVPIFVEFWGRLAALKGVYAIPFDAADPVHTPRGLKRDAETSARIAQALADAVALLNERGVPLDAPWGQLHFTVRGDAHIPVHGGDGTEGVLDAQESRWVPGLGYIPFHGSSYMQVVTFDADGPVADAVLSYSQSTNPASPHYADQTWRFSQKRWSRLPFKPAEIAAQRISSEHVGE